MDRYLLAELLRGERPRSSQPQGQVPEQVLEQVLAQAPPGQSRRHSPLCPLGRGGARKVPPAPQRLQNATEGPSKATKSHRRPHKGYKKPQKPTTTEMQTESRDRTIPYHVLQDKEAQRWRSTEPTPKENEGPGEENHIRE